MIREMSADQPIEGAATLEDIRTEVLTPQRLNSLVFGVFAAVALAIAIVGVAGVLTFSVSARTREFGIRMALGARSSDVLRDVARDVAVVLGAGAGIGLVFASLVILAMRAFARPAPGIAIYRPSLDPLQLGAIAVFIVAVGVAAAFIPARRAVRVSPISSLRQE